MADNLSTQISNELMDLTSQIPRVEADLIRQLEKGFKSLQADMLAEVARHDITGVAAQSYREKRTIALIVILMTK